MAPWQVFSAIVNTREVMGGGHSWSRATVIVFRMLEVGSVLGFGSKGWGGGFR